MPPEGDTQAPGASITLALCGHWGHEPPCPLAPHHTRTRRSGNEVQVRTLFVTEPELESLVRRRIDVALADGRLDGPDGLRTTWQLRSSHRSDLLLTETDHVRRLAAS